MTEPTPRRAPVADTGTDQSVAEEFGAFVAWLQQVAGVSADLSQLLGLELKLAAGDLGRLIGLGLLALPVLLLAWIGLSVCLSWLVYILSGLPTTAFITFPALQIGVLLFIRQRCRRYSENLSLPRVRQQLNAFVKGNSNESHAVDR